MKTTRRDFVRKSTTATAVAAGLFDIVPSRVLSLHGQTAPSDTVNLGHIGIGGRGRGFLRAEAQLGKDVLAPPNLGGDGKRMMKAARSVALCDVDLKRLDDAATRVGGQPKIYRDFRKLLEDKSVDAVVIASPDHWHALMTILACQAGKDVYVEKPACNTIEEGRAMVTAAERYGRVVQVGSQGRSQEAAWQAATYIQNGQIGKVSRVACWHFGTRVGST